MTKVAILIPSPGAVDNVAKGTSEDCDKWVEFLCSDTGGAWNDSEIVRLTANPSSTNVCTAIATAASYDYAIVAFSGHGKIEKEDGEWITKVLLNDNPNDTKRWLPDYELRPRSPRGLVSIDSCRWDPTGQYRMKAANESVVNLSFSQYYEKREAHRKLFEDDLSKCERGTIMMYGCDFGEVAEDVHTRGGDPGGLFTFSLLKAAIAWHDAPSNSGVYKVNKAFTEAFARVKVLRPLQNPQFEPGRRLGHFPLAVKTVEHILYS